MRRLAQTRRVQKQGSSKPTHAPTCAAACAALASATSLPFADSSALRAASTRSASSLVVVGGGSGAGWWPAPTGTYHQPWETLSPRVPLSLPSRRAPPLVAPPPLPLPPHLMRPSSGSAAPPSKAISLGLHRSSSETSACSLVEASCRRRRRRTAPSLGGGGDHQGACKRRRRRTAPSLEGGGK